MEAALNGPAGRTVLGTGVLSIGRAPDNTLVINDPQASSHHVEVSPGPDGQNYQVTDQNSTNGTYINEQRLTPYTPSILQSGDTMRIGSLRFTYEAPAPGTFHSAQTLSGSPLGAAPTIYAQPPAPGGSNPPAAPMAFAPPPPQMTYPPAAGPGYSQPGFNQAAYPPSGQPSPRRKSRAGVWIGIIVLLLLLVGAGFAGYTYYMNRSTPEKTLQAYCTALKNSDSQGIYATLSSELQENTDLSKIKTGLKLVNFVAGGGITACTYSNVQQNGNSASATVTLTPARGSAVGEPAQLIDENGQWKITTGSKLPGLSGL